MDRNHSEFFIFVLFALANLVMTCHDSRKLKLSLLAALSKGVFLFALPVPVCGAELSQALMKLDTDARAVLPSPLLTAGCEVQICAATGGFRRHSEIKN